MQSVRRRITEILKENGSATVAELADELGMAQVSVRHHLDILVGEDLVELAGVRRRDGAGRPSQVYALTPNALALFPQRNAQLAAHVLNEMKAVLPDDEVQRILLRVADRTAEEAPRPLENQSLEERLDQVTSFLTQKGFAARWESRDGHYALYACNCPYSGVVEEHPELCVMDQAMISKLLPGAQRSEVMQWQSHSLDVVNRCTYVVSAAAAEMGQPAEGSSQG